MKVVDPYRFVSGDFILDDVSGGAGGWSVRKLSSSYSGFAMTIRRSSDNAETDISFDGSNEVSGNSNVSAGGDLSTWAGVDDLFVKVWYDQVGSYDLSNTTTSQQPILHLTTGPGSHAYVSADINRHLFHTTADPYSAHTEGSMFSVLTNASDNFTLSSADAALDTRFISFNGARIVAQNSAVGMFVYSVAGTAIFYGDDDIIDAAWHYVMWSSNGTAYNMRSDGVVQTVNVASGVDNGHWFGDISGRDNLSFGKLLRSSAITTNSNASEFIYFNPDLTSGDIGIVETSITNFYGL